MLTATAEELLPRTLRRIAGMIGGMLMLLSIASQVQTKQLDSAAAI
jgi:hypothetical protein